MVGWMLRKRVGVYAYMNKEEERLVVEEGFVKNENKNEKMLGTFFY